MAHPALSKTFFLAILTLTSFSPIHAQTLPDALDSFFTAASSRQEISGNVLVAEKGTILYKRSFGFANIEAKRPNTDSTTFKLASISKIFTATTVLQLIEKGKIGLDDHFIKYFPQFPYPTVTIRQMLSHTSGLPDYAVFQQMIGKEPDRICTDEDIIPEMQARKLPLLFPSGVKWSYCNLNFDLLVLLVEKISNMKFGDYLRKNIFAPAKMKDTYISTPLIHPAAPSNEAYNYDYPFLFSQALVRIMDDFALARYKIHYYNLAGLVGDGYLYSTTEDLYRFDQALYEGRLLSPASLERAFTPARLNNGEPANASIGIGAASYGLGWFIFQDSSAGKIVWHTGGEAGCWTILLRNITRKQFVVLLDNNEDPSGYKNGVSALNLLNDKPVVTVKKSLALVYGRDLAAKDGHFAISHLQELRTDSAGYYLSEGEMNRLGYQFMANGFRPQSLETFMVITLLFPGSGNAFDSYGEALLKCGKKEEAIMMYKKSILLDPKNEDGRKTLEKLLQK